MIPFSQASDQRSWLLRIWQGWFPQDFYKYISFLNIGLSILLLGISVIAFLSNDIPFSLAMIMAVSGVVFAVIVVMFIFYEAGQNSEDSPFALELSNLGNTQGHRNIVKWTHGQQALDYNFY